MCECRSDIEQRITDRYATRMPESREVDATLMGYAITFGDDLRVRAYMPVEIHHTATVKKTGVEKRKIEKVSMFFTYCPFCGEKLAKDG